MMSKCDADVILSFCGHMMIWMILQTDGGRWAGDASSLWYKKGVCVVFKWENFMCDGLVKNEHWVGYVFLSVSRPEDWWQSDMACKCLQIYVSLYPNTISIEISIFFSFNIQLLGRNCKKYNPPCSLSIHPLCYVVSFQCQPARPTPEQKKKLNKPTTTALRTEHTMHNSYRHKIALSIRPTPMPNATHACLPERLSRLWAGYTSRCPTAPAK